MLLERGHRPALTIKWIGYPKGWYIPDRACCLRCRMSGGDHHRCWIDRCPAVHVQEV